MNIERILIVESKGETYNNDGKKSSLCIIPGEIKVDDMLRLTMILTQSLTTSMHNGHYNPISSECGNIH
jgi:hypothetical protein